LPNLRQADPSVLLLILLMFTALAAAQIETASVSGQITDQQGAAVVDAEVVAINIDTGISYPTASNRDGVYVIPTLRPGRYRMVVRGSGFKEVVKTGLQLHVQDSVSQNFALVVGSSLESVTVVAESESMQTSAAVATLVDRQFVENMPLNGRSFQSLIELTPGVTTAKTYYTSAGQFSVNGQRTDANYFSVDGVSANVGITQGNNVYLGSAGAGAEPALSNNGGTNSVVSVDAMQEYKIQSSTFAAEFGRTPGAQISIVTRSGSNQIHSTVFEYLRNDMFDAADWFTTYNGLAKPAERQNDFGGVVGGPVLKDKLFFFFSYEGLRLRLPQTKTIIVPSTTSRQSASTALQPLLNAFPQPSHNLPAFPDNDAPGDMSALFAGSFSNASTLDATSLRVDYVLNKKINVFARYNHAPSNGTQRGAFDVYTLSTLSHTLANVDTLTVGATAPLSSTLVNEVRLNRSAAKGATVVTADNYGGAIAPSDAYLFQSHPEANRSNSVFMAFFWPTTGGYYVGNDATNRQNQLNFVDTGSWSHGTHNVKTGVDYRRLTPRNGYRPYDFGYGFNGFADVSGSATYAFVDSSEASSLRLLFQDVSLFTQDTWQVRPDFAVTYGVRWDLNPPPSEMTGRPLFTATNLNSPANAALAPKGTPLWATSYTNVAPRVGISYGLRQTPGRETVLRGGAGIFFDLGNNSGGQGTLGFPYSRSRYFYGTTYPLSTADAAAIPYSLDPPYVFMFAFDPNLKTPRTYQWNLSLQQSLSSEQSISLTYLGALGRDLLRREMATAAAGVNADFTYLDVIRNDAYSNYHALQVQYQKRVSHSLQALASYSWSHGLDNSSGVAKPEPYYTVYRPSLDYGDSDFDVRHAFSAAITYSIPAPRSSGWVRAVAANWSVDSLFRAHTPLPVDVLSGVDAFGLNWNAESDHARPDVVKGQPLYLYGSQYPGRKAINPAAFEVPTAQTTGSNVQGDLRRNALRGYGAWQEDLAIRRDFPITERMKLQFRAEFFNVFNHPNFGDPGANTSTNQLSDPHFGLSERTLAQSLGSGGADGGFAPLYQIGGPRSTQFALKLIF
jgi:Carboxypeptidase regulatory-like domain